MSYCLVEIITPCMQHSMNIKSNTSSLLAERSCLGCTIHGCTSETPKSIYTIGDIKHIIHQYSQEFNKEKNKEDETLSMEDKRTLNIVDKSLKRVNTKFEVVVLFHNPGVNFPNNYS